jgi:hypothetical protein
LFAPARPSVASDHHAERRTAFHVEKNNGYASVVQKRGGVVASDNQFGFRDLIPSTSLRSSVVGPHRRGISASMENSAGMRPFKAGLIYFVLVFALGWVLGPIR